MMYKQSYDEEYAKRALRFLDKPSIVVNGQMYYFDDDEEARRVYIDLINGMGQNRMYDFDLKDGGQARFNLFYVTSVALNPAPYE